MTSIRATVLGFGSSSEAPVASFITDVSSFSLGGVIRFTNTSVSLTADLWMVQGGLYTFVEGTNEHSLNPVIRFWEDVTYTVSLRAWNAYGTDLTSDTYSKASPIPVASFTISDATPNVGQIVTFTDTSTETPTSWVWAISPSTYVFEGGTSATSQNPQVSFTNTGTEYTVNLTATNSGGSGTTAFTNNITTAAPGPTDIPNLWLWWDFSDSSNRTDNGTLISAVIDKSGNGRNGTAGGVGGANILLGTDGNGIEYADFSVSEDNWMGMSSQGTFSQFTFVFFHHYNAGDGFDAALTGNSINDYYRPRYGWIRISGGTTTGLPSVAPGYIGTHAILRNSSNGIRVYKNGNIQSTTKTNSSPYDFRYLGNGVSNTTNSKIGRFYGLAVYNRALSESELDTLNTYAADILQI